MNSEKSRTAEEIFSVMHRELRSWNQDIPESPDRMDPILRILLRLFSNQLSVIDRKIEKVWENAGNSLIKALYPENLRWPVPAYTVMRAEPTDPVVEVDTHVRFFYKEDRRQGQTFFFTPQRNEKLIKARTRYVFVQSENIVIDLSPHDGETTSTHARTSISMSENIPVRIYLGIEHHGTSSNFSHSTIFLKGNMEALKQLRWAKWLPGNQTGAFSETATFCPGTEESLGKMFQIDGNAIDWGGLRKSENLFKALEDNFIIIPQSFCDNFQPGPINRELKRLLPDDNIVDDDKLFWIRLDLPSGGDKSVFNSPFEIYFNCFIAVNKNELTLFKHTGGNRLVEIEIPEEITGILEILNVIDSNGHQYHPRHEVFKDRNSKFYAIEESHGKLLLWFDFSSSIEFPPDSITVNYAITSGTEANGIEAGKIRELYENHPGIETVVNIVPVSGGIPAKNEEHIITEISARLRNRDRAMSFSEIASWARTFDPRINRVDCRNGVEKTPNGVRRCVDVDIIVDAKKFYSNDEMKLLQTRLNSFLKSRAPVNSQFKVEIIKS